MWGLKKQAFEIVAVSLVVAIVIILYPSGPAAWPVWQQAALGALFAVAVRVFRRAQER